MLILAFLSITSLLVDMATEAETLNLAQELSKFEENREILEEGLGKKQPFEGLEDFVSLSLCGRGETDKKFGEVVASISIVPVNQNKAARKFQLA